MRINRQGIGQFYALEQVFAFFGEDEESALGGIYMVPKVIFRSNFSYLF